MRNDKIEIKKNGKIIKLSDGNIQNALSHVEIGQHQTLFSELKKFLATKNFSTIIIELLRRPYLEIIYNTYGNLEIIHGVNLRFLQNENSPSKILGLPKSVWNMIKDINILSKYKHEINSQLDSIQDLCIKYNQNLDLVNNIIKISYLLGFRDSYPYICELVEYEYDLQRLYAYLTEDIYTYQGIASSKEGLKILCDYVTMCDKMGTPYETFPKSLKLRHDLAMKNFNIQCNEEETKNINDILNSQDYIQYRYQEYGGEYAIINPTTTDDIINEGKCLNHCVPCYLDKIKEKRTTILFMRDVKNINKPLVTLDIRNGILMQYAGVNDSKPTSKQMAFIKKWAKKFSIDVRSLHTCYMNF